MKIKHSILAISSIFIIVGCGGVGVGSTETSATEGSNETSNSKSSITTPNPYPAEYLSDEDKAVFLKVINDARSVQQDCGSKGIFPAAPALTWSEELYSAADEHSNDMAQSDTFQHDGSGTDSDWTGMDLGEKSSVPERLENNGYSEWNKIGENIAAGTERDTAQKAVDAWLESDEHCAILMSAGYTEVGMAHVENANAQYTHYWTQDFGNR